MHDRAVVRVRRDTAVVGAGFLAAPGVVLTCAHVVADALGISRDGTPDDGAAVMVDFPLIAADRTLSARVPVKWWRPFGHDVAVLALAPESAPGVPPAPLAAVPAGAGASFSAFGFPKGFPGGRRERGEVIGPNADGLLEIRPDRADAHVHFVEQGFSGTPAFGKDGVIGMVVATGPKPENRLAYLIPVPWLERGWPPLARPYRGLAPFDAESARWFRGRDDFTTRILDRLAGQAVVVVVGSSGSGKSSVVRAGVAPALTARGWTVATCRIGTQPFRSLARALVDHLYPGQSVGKRTDLTAELAGKLAQPGPAALDHIDGLLESGSRLLVILDQFEELVTRADAAEREAFDGFLCRLIGRGTGSALRVVVTLRSDYTEAIEPLDCARHLLNDARVHLTPMTRQELAQAVRGPADDLGVRFADGIDGDLIGQVTRTPALLPLLQYTLQELWEALDGAVITDAALQACGGLDGVLGRRADAVLQGLDDGGREAARRLFTGHLVNVTETGVGHDTKRTATRAEVGAALWEVARAFAAERVWLLAIQESEPGGATVEIAHEALIRNWDTLRGWLDAVRDLRIWEAAVTRQMAAVNGDSVLETWNPRQVEEARRMLALPDVTPAVRDHAERVLANTEAMDLWSRLRSFDRHEDTLGLLPGLPSRVRDTMIGQLMVSTACAGAFLRSPVETGLGLFGVDPARCRRVAPWVAEPPGVDEPVPLLRARCLAGVLLELPLNPDAIVVALRGTTDRDQCAALGTGLAAVSGRVPDPEGHTAVLLEALRGTRNPYQCAALGAGLAAMFGRVSDPDGHAAALLEALRGTRDRDQCTALGRGLAAVSGRVSGPEGHAAALLNALRETRDSNQRAALRTSLAAVSGRVSDPDGHAAALLEALRGTKNPGQCAALGTGLAAVSGRVSDPDGHAAALLEALRGTRDRDQRAALGAGLEAVSGRVSDPDGHAAALLNALRETRDSNQRAALRTGPAAVSGRVSDPDGHAAALLEALRGTKNPGQCAALGTGLEAVSGRVSDPDGHAAALLEALLGTLDSNQCAALGRGLAAVSERVSDTDGHAAALLEALRGSTDRSQCAALGRGLAAVSGRVSGPVGHAVALLESLRQTTDLHQCAALGTGLAAVVPHVSDPASSQSIIEVIGVMRLPMMRVMLKDNSRRRFGSLTRQESPLARVIKDVLGCDTLSDAADALRAARPGIDLSRPWPEPLIDG